jgi:hypothetical protein
LTFHINKDGDRIVYIRLMDAQGEALGFFGPQVTSLPGGSARFELSPLNPPARAQIVLASETESRTLPFVFSIP